MNYEYSDEYWVALTGVNDRPGVYALKQPHPDGHEWIQEFDTYREAVQFQSHSGGTLVRRERVDGQPGLWWVEVTE